MLTGPISICRRWSDAGCRVASSNATATECECDHLTHFAVMMRPLQRGEERREEAEAATPLSPAAAEEADGGFVLGRLDIFGSVLAAVIVFAVFISVVMVRQSTFTQLKVETDHCMYALSSYALSSYACIVKLCSAPDHIVNFG